MEAKDFVEALIGTGMTQSEISDRTGIPQPSISKVARGEVDDVLSRNYRKLQALHDKVCGGTNGIPHPAEALPAKAGA